GDVLHGFEVVLGGEVHGVADDLGGGHLACEFGHRHVRVVGEDHGIGPVEEVLAVLRVHAHQVENGQQGQLGGDFFDKLAFATADDPVDHVPGVLAELGLVGIHRLGGEGLAHQTPDLLVQGRVHADDGL